MRQHPDIAAEIDRNYDAFRRSLGDYMPEHSGKIALLRAGTLVGFFDGVGAAWEQARRDFPDGLYSLQPVEEEPVDLGWFSHVPG